MPKKIKLPAIVKHYTQSPILFVEDSPSLIKKELSEEQLSKIIKSSLTLKEVIKFIQEAGVYELYQIEAEAKLEFRRRGYYLG